MLGRHLSDNETKDLSVGRICMPLDSSDLMDVYQMIPQNIAQFNILLRNLSHNRQHRVVHSVTQNSAIMVPIQRFS